MKHNVALKIKGKAKTKQKKQINCIRIKVEGGCAPGE